MTDRPSAMSGSIKCVLPIPIRAVWLAVLALVTTVTVIGAVSEFAASDLIRLIVAVWLWFVTVYWVAWSVEVMPDEHILFRFIARRVSVPVSGVSRIRPFLGGFDPVVVVIHTYRGRQLRVLRAMSNFDELIGFVRRHGDPGVQFEV